MYFKVFTHAILGADKSKIFEAGWNFEKELMYYSCKSKNSTEIDLFSLLGTSVFALKAIHWLDEAHPHYKE